MIETEARVLSVEPGFAWVEPRPHSPCGQCHPEHGCRSLQMARMFALREPRFRVLDPLGVAPGQRVNIAVPESGLLRSAGMLYVLPVLALIAGAMFGSRYGDSIAALLALVCLLFTLGCVHLYARRLAADVRYQPHIASLVDVQTVSMEFVKTCRSRS